MEFPIRINKYIAFKGIASRREADLLIEAGKVLINGKKATMGQMVEESDHVEIVGKQKTLSYYAFNKPIGIVTHSPQEGEQEILDILSIPEKVFPVGRLDKESHGLIILTNDGRITSKLLGPEKHIEKEYVVTLTKPINNLLSKHIQQGIILEDGSITQPAHFEKIDDKTFKLTITEGKRHQIRRMCAAFGYTIKELKRIRIASIHLGRLKSGEIRKIEGEELSTFLKEINL